MQLEFPRSEELALLSSHIPSGEDMESFVFSASPTSDDCAFQHDLSATARNTKIANKRIESSRWLFA
jgi:hypothetical protein